MIGYGLIYKKDGEIKKITSFARDLSVDNLLNIYLNNTENKVKRDSGEKAQEQGFISNNELTKKGQYLMTFLKTYFENVITAHFNPLKLENPDSYKPSIELLTLQHLFGEEPFYDEKGNLLRPAADFGVFNYMQNAEHEYPLRVFEMATCYRNEAKATALFRPKNFHLPDLHCFIESKDLESEVRDHLRVYSIMLDIFNIDYVPVIRTTEGDLSNLENNIHFLSSERDVFVNVVPSRKRYWTSKIKFIGIDEELNNLQLSTVQVDYDTSRLFNIKGNPTIIHSSPGSLERWAYTLIDKNFII